MPLITPPPDDHRSSIEELMLNLPFVNSLNTAYLFVVNRRSRKVHLTVGSCLPAVSMRKSRRFYTDDIPADTTFCRFCEDQYVRSREERVRDGA